MPTVLRIVLLGFTEFERNAFESFFQHAAGAGPAHELVQTLAHADCAVADAEDPVACGRLRAAGLLSRSIVLGSTPRPGAALQLPRPINLALVLRGLDTIAGSRESGPSDPMPLDEAPARSAPGRPRHPAAPTPAPRVPPRRHDALSHSERVLEELAYRTINLPGEVDARRLVGEVAPPAAAPSAEAALPIEHVLVVSTDPADYRQIVLSLQGFGFQMHLARRSEEALHALLQRPHRYVFIDPRTPGTDALMLCRLAREAGSTHRQPSTVVVMLVHPDVDAEALQRALPSADATLRSPLGRTDLLRLVGEREVSAYSFAETTQTITRL